MGLSSKNKHTVLDMVVSAKKHDVKTLKLYISPSNKGHHYHLELYHPIGGGFRIPSRRSMFVKKLSPRDIKMLRSAGLSEEEIQKRINETEDELLEKLKFLDQEIQKQGLNLEICKLGPKSMGLQKVLDYIDVG